jgi:ArsR family transcriptional regulator
MMPASQPPIFIVKADFFRALGHPARVRILELLRDGERNVRELQEALDVDSSNASQHLGALRKQGLVESRKAGTSTYYRARDPKIFELLETARQILTSGLFETRALLDELAAAQPLDAPRKPR